MAKKKPTKAVKPSKNGKAKPPKIEPLPGIDHTINRMEFTAREALAAYRGVGPPELSIPDENDAVGRRAKSATRVLRHLERLRSALNGLDENDPARWIAEHAVMLGQWYVSMETCVFETAVVGKKVADRKRASTGQAGSKRKGDKTRETIARLDSELGSRKFNDSDNTRASAISGRWPRGQLKPALTTIATYLRNRRKTPRAKLSQ